MDARRRIASALLLAGLVGSGDADAQLVTVRSHLELSSESNFGGVLANGDQLGSALAALGDLNGDGTADVAIGAPGDGAGADAQGAVWIAFLYPNGAVRALEKIGAGIGGLPAVLEPADNFGASVAALGDVDMDGVLDLAVGAPGDADGGPARGAVYVLFLNADGTVKAHTKLSDIAGFLNGVLHDLDLFGFSLAALGDIDGNGVPDLAVGAPGDDEGGAERGAVWVVRLATSGKSAGSQKLASSSGPVTDLGNGDFLGWALAAVGDQNGDGRVELYAGSPGDDDGGANRGAVRRLSLEPSGALFSQTKISDTAGNFPGVLDDDDFFGAGLASAGDLDLDGIPDVAVGAPNDDDGGAQAGAVWVLVQNSNGFVRYADKLSETQGGFTGALASGDTFGTALAMLGDLDADGRPTLATGAPGDDGSGADRGAVWQLELDALLPGAPADHDHDSVADRTDNCIATANLAQADADDDGIGDACEACLGGPTLCTSDSVALGATDFIPIDLGTLPERPTLVATARATTPGSNATFRVSLESCDQFGHGGGFCPLPSTPALTRLELNVYNCYPFASYRAGTTCQLRVEAQSGGGAYLLRVDAFSDPPWTLAPPLTLVDPQGVAGAGLLSFISEGSNFRWLYDGTDAIGQCALQGNVGSGGLDISYTPTGASGWDCCTYQFDGTGGVDSDVGQVVVQIPVAGQVPDDDGDGFLDLCDNCRYRSNETQADANTDGVGDVCKCGDLSGGGAVTSADVTLLRQHLASSAGTLDASQLTRCAVVGSVPTACELRQLAVLRRALAGRPPGLVQACSAALTP